MQVSPAPNNKLHWSPRGSYPKLALFGLLALMMLSVIVFTELPMLRANGPGQAHLQELQPWLLPHAACAMLAFLLGPLQFSSRLRQHILRRHRLLGKAYVGAVYVAALMVVGMHYLEPTPPPLLTLAFATAVQGIVWVLATTVAWVAARQHNLAQHRLWMARSYGVTVSFVLARVLNPLPAFKNMSLDSSGALLLFLTLLAVLLPELLVNRRTSLGSRNSSAA
ncbi:MAG: hypothetical protein JWR44_2841 [Hymenobacter sp.]|jgi:hypothetical protein|nr:hypothetical protein [Hymenobacter sp.]